MATKETSDEGMLRARARSGASWFYWIGALSLANSIIAARGSTRGFVAGLGVTQIIDGVALAVGPQSRILALGFDALISGLVIAMGVWAGRNTRAYLCGMILYVLDAAIFLLARDWVGFGFHGLVLFFLWGGYVARRALDRQVVAPSPSEEIPLDKAA